MFNKRHYEAIAEVISRGKGVLFEDNPNYGMFLVGMCDLFESDNPDFDRVRFIEACGLGIDAPEIIKVS